MRGHHQKPSRQVYSDEQFVGAQEEEFIPLRDEDLYSKIAMGDPDALCTIDYDTAIPQSRLRPGEAGSDLPNIEGFRKPITAEETGTFQNIHFDYDSYVVHGEHSTAIVKRISEYVKSHPDMYLFIEGHCDQKGTAAYNLALGARRANAMRNLLIKSGIHPDRLLTISYGKERLVTQKDEPEARKQNRRTQFKLYG